MLDVDLDAGEQVGAQHGAEFLCVSFAIHPNGAWLRIDQPRFNAPIRQVVVTNTLPISDDKRFDALQVLSIAPIIAKALDAVFEDTSVSEIFRGDNV